VREVLAETVADQPLVQKASGTSTDE
jgi:hypothetical protein